MKCFESLSAAVVGFSEISFANWFWLRETAMETKEGLGKRVKLGSCKTLFVFTGSSSLSLIFIRSWLNVTFLS